MMLEMFFSENPKVALGFSGGVDSSYLLYVAKKYGADIKPYFIKTVFQPAFELWDAKKVAEFTGVELTVIETNILKNFNVTRNDEKRCYYCKKTLFTLLKENAKNDGYSVIIDGNNASDDFYDRPGMKAVEELNVKSPLRECGLTKDEIRRLSKEAGLFTWNKPAYACLATRIQSNSEIRESDLTKIEEAENILSIFGFSDCRVRLIDNDCAKIQIQEKQFLLLKEKREEILEKFPKFNSVVLDLHTR